MVHFIVSPYGTTWEIRTDLWRGHDPVSIWEAMGLIPYFLDPEDPRKATEQFDEKYIGAWDAQPGFSLIDGIALKYPEDPLMYPYACCTFNDERVMVYECGYVCVVHGDKTFEVARMD